MVVAPVNAEPRPLCRATHLLAHVQLPLAPRGRVLRDALTADAPVAEPLQLHLRCRAALLLLDCPPVECECRNNLRLFFSLLSCDSHGILLLEIRLEVEGKSFCRHSTNLPRFHPICNGSQCFFMLLRIFENVCQFPKKYTGFRKLRSIMLISRYYFQNFPTKNILLSLG